MIVSLRVLFYLKGGFRMFALLILLAAILGTVYLVISADNESFIVETKEFVFSFVESLKNGMSLKEVEDAVAKIEEIDKPILDSFNFDEGVCNYCSFFKFEEGFAVYEGIIKFYFVYDELKKVEVLKK